MNQENAASPGSCAEYQPPIWQLLPAAAPAPLARKPEPPEPAPSSPYGPQEIGAAARTPHRFVDLILSDPGRLAATIAGRVRLPVLLSILVVASVACAVPYGLVLRPDRFWNVALLFFGSTLVCVPSLHVFGTFLGFRTTLGQTLALATVISSVAGLFTLGFAPILWFLRSTMPGDASSHALPAVSALLLGASMFAGVTQFGRCLAARSDLRFPRSYLVLVVLWVGLLLFISSRMAYVLGLLA